MSTVKVWVIPRAEGKHDLGNGTQVYSKTSLFWTEDGVRFVIVLYKDKDGNLWNRGYVLTDETITKAHSHNGKKGFIYSALKSTKDWKEWKEMMWALSRSRLDAGKFSIKLEKETGLEAPVVQETTAAAAVIRDTKSVELKDTLAALAAKLDLMED